MSNFNYWLGFSLIAGILYRIGGWKVSPVRDWGLPCLFVAYLWHLHAISGFWQWISILPCFFAMGGALTTYRYIFPKPKDYSWWHYAMHGFFCSLSAIFYAWASGHWIGFGIRVVICTVFMGAWYFLGRWNDNLHEGGRGAVLLATVPMII